MERAAAYTKCPECGGKKVDSLASTESLLRFQCSNLDCLHEWITTRDRLGAAIEADRERRAQDREANVANLKCKECGKKYKHPKRLENHETACRGAGDGSVEENPDLPMDPPRKVETASTLTTTIKPIKGGKSRASITAGVLEMLEDKRLERIAVLMVEDAQLVEIDGLIAKVGGEK